MRLALPDEYVRRLEEVARNQYRGTPGFGVYYYSDEQLAAILGDGEKRELAQMQRQRMNKKVVLIHDLDAIGRGVRYAALGFLAVRYGSRASAYLAEHGTTASLIVVGVLAAGFAAYMLWTKVRAANPIR
jgi:hypothetical protein